MVEIPAGGGAGAPAAPAAPASPTITFGDHGGGEAPKLPAETPGAGAENLNPETPDVFEFNFEGDNEKYSYKDDAEKATEPEAGYDASKPFDPAIEAALKDNPDALKALKQGHYELRQWKGSGFKTPAEVKAYKERIDTLGGPEQIEGYHKETESRIAALHSGDESALDWLSKEHPEGMTKLAVPYLNRLSKAAPAVWAREMGKVFMATLLQPNAQGMSSLAAFNSLYDAVGDNPAAKKLLSQIADTINSVDKAAKSSGEEQGRNAGASEESRKLEVEKRTVYLQKVNINASPLVDSAAKQALKVALKGRKLSPEVEKDILTDIKTGFNNLQKQDATFQQNASDLLKNQDTDRFLRVLKSAISRNMPRAALREARKYKGLAGDTSQRRAEGQSRTESAAGSSALPQRVKYTGPMKQGGPDPAQIDYAQMRSQFGRKGTDEMLGRREFLKKGDAKTIFTW